MRCKGAVGSGRIELVVCRPSFSEEVAFGAIIDGEVSYSETKSWYTLRCTVPILSSNNTTERSIGLSSRQKKKQGRKISVKKGWKKEKKKWGRRYLLQVRR